MTRVAEHFVSDLEELPRIRAAIRNACRDHSPDRLDDDDIARLELAITEAASNIIRHAYEGKPGLPLRLEIDADDDKLLLSFIHKGKEFDPSVVAPPVFDGTKSGGFGVFLIEQCVDRVVHATLPTGEISMTLIKCWPKQGTDDGCDR